MFIFCSQFASFDYSQSGYETSTYNAPGMTAYAGSIMTPAPISNQYNQPADYNNFEDEPPLLEGNKFKVCWL